MSEEELKELKKILAKQIPNNKNDYVGPDNLKMYKVMVDKYPILNRQEEKIVLKAIKYNIEGVKDFFIGCNLRFVIKMAKKYENYGAELLDIIELGNEGLIKAFNNYNTNIGVRFLTYAGYVIRTNIERHLVDNILGLSTKLNMEQDINKYQKVERELQMELDAKQIRREPTSKEIAKFMGISIERVEDIKRTIYKKNNLVYLDKQKYEDSEETIKEFVEDSRYNTEEEVIDKITEQKLTELIPLSRRIINNDNQFRALIYHIVYKYEVTAIPNEGVHIHTMRNRISYALYKLRTSKILNEYLKNIEDPILYEEILEIFRELYKNSKNKEETFLNGKVLLREKNKKRAIKTIL